MSAALAWLTAGCSLLNNHDVIGFVDTRSGSPDQRFNQSMALDWNCGHSVPSTVPVSDDTYSVFILTDTHLDGSHANLDKFIAAYQQAILPPPGSAGTRVAPVILHLGDLIDAHEERNFRDAKQWLSPVWDRLFITPGNHDIYYGQWQKFLDCCGCGSYYLDVVCPSGARDMFLSLDSSAGTLGLRQKAWLKETLAAAVQRNCRHIIVFTHTHFFHTDHSQFPTSNFLLEETYELSRLFSEYGVGTVISGHDHSFEYNRFNGIDYHVVGALKDGTQNPGYAVLSVSGKGVLLERKNI